MTLAEIMRLALRQLDEDPADISDFADLFRSYANLGYKIIVSRYYKPKKEFSLQTDENGEAELDGLGIDHILILTDKNGSEVWYRLSGDGSKIATTHKNAELNALCILDYAPMKEDSDQPQFPEHAHHALVDYVCCRYLLNGNAAKQNRAMMFYQQFEQTARTIKPQGSGSVTHFRNLYAASNIRNVGW